MELKGVSQGKCVYYQRVLNSSVSYSQEFRDSLNETGLNETQIDEAEELSNNASKMTIGMEYTCRIYVSNLTDMLEEWSGGNFSSDSSNKSLNAFECIQSCASDSNCEDILDCTSYRLLVNVSIVIENKTLTVTSIDAEETITVDVDGNSSTIEEYETEIIEGLEIKNTGKDENLATLEINCDD